MRCEVCRFWDRDKAGAVLWGMNPDAAAKMERWGDCNRHREPDALMRPYGDGHEVEDEGLSTHQGFGCSQFEDGRCPETAVAHGSLGIAMCNRAAGHEGQHAPHPRFWDAI